MHTQALSERNASNANETSVQKTCCKFYRSTNEFDVEARCYRYLDESSTRDDLRKVVYEASSLYWFRDLHRDILKQPCIALKPEEMALGLMILGCDQVLLIPNHMYARLLVSFIISKKPIDHKTELVHELDRFIVIYRWGLLIRERDNQVLVPECYVARLE